MKRVIVFYEHIVREYYSMEKVVQILKRLSLEPLDVHLRQYDLEWKKSIKEARNNGIDAIVVPYLYADDPDYAGVLPFREINPNCVVINMHHEQISAKYNEDFQLPNGNLATNGCFHFVWSEAYAERLKNHGVDEQLISVTGNVRLDATVELKSAYSKETLGSLFGLNPKKKWILYSENRRFQKITEKNRLKHPILRSIDPEIYKELRTLDNASLFKTFEQINNLSSDFFDSFELIYRLHPGTRLQHRLQDRVKVVNELPIHDWLRCCDLVLVWNSTTAFEADVFGTPVIRHESIPSRDLFRVQGLEAYPVITELADINEGLIDSLKNEQAGKERYRTVYGAADGLSSYRAAKEILKLLSNPPNLFPLNDISGVICSKNRRLLRETIGLIFLRCGLLDCIKWPRGIYNHKNELLS